MSKRVFKITNGSLQHRFGLSRAKIQIFGGGFANGKTANACIKGLELARSYPGSNGLIARSTYPKLNDTIRKEWLKWCPESWIKRFPRSQNSENTCYMENGTSVNFRYVQQQGKGGESTTSNLLSATYDWIIVDQIDDPEFSFKDLLDLIGRLRGSTPYTGDDVTMPETGPRWLILTANPTRNWLYKKLIRPIHSYGKTGHVSTELQQIMDAFDRDTLEGLIELFEGSTYENADNLEPDYIKLLEGLYRGQMRERFLLGNWGAYEGLVYPMFDETTHVIEHSWAVEYYKELVHRRYDIEVIESYDHGIAKPSCYLFAYVDPFGNIIVLDGFYEKELAVGEAIRRIRKTRHAYLGDKEPQRRILADPSVFKRGTGDKKVVGQSVADIFYDEGLGVKMERGNNEIVNGIIKVQGYLNLHKMHRHVVTGDHPSPYLYVSRKCEFLLDEIVDYYWNTNTEGEYEDKPKDKNDHAMDALKYLLSRKPPITKFLTRVVRDEVAKKSMTQWHEQEPPEGAQKGHRYGRQSAA